MALVTSQNGVDLIKSFEGCVLKAYQDSVGIWTIGYGHTKGVHSGMTITAIQAQEYLISDLVVFERAVNSCVTVPMTQNMFDALVSFSFNVGAAALKKSTLLANLNKGNINSAATEFDKWVHAGKKILPGLVRRRAAEKELFLNSNSSQKKL